MIISTNFNDEMLDNINKIIKFILENEYSNFYKKKYNKNFWRIESIKEFQQIPFLTKDDFTTIPIKERSFFSQTEIKRYSFSSGTTKTNKISIIPQLTGPIMALESVARLEYGEQLLKEDVAKKLLLMWPVFSSAFSRNIVVEREGKIIIPGDVKNIIFSAKIAKKIKVDGIITTPTILDILIRELKKIGFDLSNITWVSLGGEFCSMQRLQYFKDELPNAFFNFRFGSSEIQGRGYRCRFLANENPNVYHPSPHSLIEIDSEDRNEFGEIIHTNLYPRPFPFIRYRTGDMAQLIDKDCGCGAKQLLIVGGRGELDMMKVSGITLHIQMIENALDWMRKYVMPCFQLHVYEQKIANKLKIQLELHLQLKKDFEEYKEDAIFNEVAAKKISDNLQLSSKANLSQMIEQGIFLPLKIRFENQLASNAHKSKYIISHIT